MARKPFLTEQEIEWGFEKWCAGYTQKEVADALFIGVETFRNAIAGRKKGEARTKI